MILKVRLGSLLPSLDTQEFPATVEAWCEILFGIVPIDRLNDCYVRAMRERRSTFPLTVTELIETWRAMKSEAAHGIRAACGICDGTGFGTAYDPKNDVEFQKECPYCFGRVTTTMEVVQ